MKRFILPTLLATALAASFVYLRPSQAQAKKFTLGQKATPSFAVDPPSSDGLPPPTSR